MEQTQQSEKLLTATEFARLLGVGPSYVTHLLNDRRIPEARRDPSNGHYRIPARRCIIPSKYPKPGRKVNEFFYHEDEIPREWIENPDSRPEPGETLDLTSIKRKLYLEELQQALIASGAGHEGRESEDMVDGSEEERPKVIEVDLALWRDSEEVRWMVNTEGLLKMGIDLKTLAQTERVRTLTLTYR